MGSTGTIRGDLGIVTPQPHRNLFPWGHPAHPAQDEAPKDSPGREEPNPVSPQIPLSGLLHGDLPQPSLIWDYSSTGAIN